MKAFSIFFGVLLALSPVVSAELPEQGIVSVEKKWEEGNGEFTWDFWLLSGEVAKKHGVALIPLVMEKSKEWKGEEALIYVPLLALLPRDKTLEKLKEYQSGSDESLKLWATEFITEFNMSDTMEAVKKYRAEQEGASRNDRINNAPDT